VKRFVFLAVLIILVVVGGFLNIPVNPRTDGTIQTSFTVREILFAVVLMAAGYAVFLYRIKKRISGSKSRFKDLYDEKEVADLRAPFRTAEDYREATDGLKNTFSPVDSGGSGKKGGRTVISAFAGGAQYIWDGETLSGFAGGPLVRFDGKYITRFGGNRIYTWENNSLSTFAGGKLYTVSGGGIFPFAGPKKYTFDGSGLSAFAGGELYSISGDTAVPPAVMIVIAEKLI
jgi:hypothetical protein